MHVKSTDIQDMWDGGTPLHEAWLDLLDRQGVRRYQVINSDRGRAAFRSMRRREIVDQLTSGELIAIGMNAMPELQLRLEIIPRRIFSLNDLDLESDDFCMHDVKYVKIRVLNGTAINKSDKFLEENKINHVRDSINKKPGPKSGADIIQAIYKEMKLNGKLNGCVTKKAIFHRMRPELEKDKLSFPNGRGLAYSTFARIMNDLA
jgi:hypothetical protein